MTIIDARTVSSHPRPLLAVWHALPGIDVVESLVSASHLHGGEPATIDGANVNLRVKDGREHVVEARAIELREGACRESTWSSAKPLAITGYEVHDWEHVEPIAIGTTSARLPATPDLYAVKITFAAEQAYQACDRFAFAIRLVVDGNVVAIEVPLRVKRYEPYEPRP